MSTKQQINHAALTGDILNAFLALSRIYLAGTERLSVLALETARGSLEDCVAASRHASGAGGKFDLEVWRAVFAQPVFERARACTRGTVEIIAGVQNETMLALGVRSAFPAMPFPLSEGWMSAVGSLSQGLREFSAMNAANMNAAVDSFSGMVNGVNSSARKAA